MTLRVDTGVNQSTATATTRRNRLAHKPAFPTAAELKGTVAQRYLPTHAQWLVRPPRPETYRVLARQKDKSRWQVTYRGRCLGQI